MNIFGLAFICVLGLTPAAMAALSAADIPFRITVGEVCRIGNFQCVGAADDGKGRGNIECDTASNKPGLSYCICRAPASPSTSTVICLTDLWDSCLKSLKDGITGDCSTSDEMACDHGSDSSKFNCNCNDFDKKSFFSTTSLTKETCTVAPNRKVIITKTSTERTNKNYTVYAGCSTRPGSTFLTTLLMGGVHIFGVWGFGWNP